MSSNNIILNRLFTQNVFKDLIEKHGNPVYLNIVRRIVNDPESRSNGEIISEIYSYMSKQYRNEYFYQNTLLNKLLIGKHSINTTVALTQIPIGKSKADFILINGKAIVYEIKTELDTFERLDSQIHDYYKAFENVCVVTCESNFDKLNKLLENTKVGICVLSDKNTLQFRKEPIADNSRISHRSLFKILHKREYENIIFSYYGKKPDVQQVFYYDECLKWFEKIPIEEAYQMTLKQLKKRNKIIKTEFLKVPYELKSLMYFYNKYNNKYSKLISFLNDGLREVM